MQARNQRSISFMKLSSCKLQHTDCRILFLTIGLSLFAHSFLKAQQNLSLNREWSLDVEKTRGIIKSAKPASVVNTRSNFKPYIGIRDRPERDTSKSIFIRKLKKENLFIVNDTASKFHLTIDPLLHFEFGRDLKDTSEEKLYKNARGILVRGDIGSNFSFESSFLETQATFPTYVDEYIKGTNNLFSSSANYPYNIIPGQGRAKTFKKNGYDFAMASGYVSYSPTDYFNLQIGHGKHFVGDGYRSLLLSDNSFNHPFARITTSFGKFQYTNLYTSFMNLTDGGVKTPPNTERLFQKKAGNFHFLNWNMHRRVEMGLFQGLIWQASDSMNRQHFNLNYFSPIIYTSLISEGLHGTNNVLLGATWKIKFTNSISIYGQFMVDDFYTTKNFVYNKTGFQAGTKYFDLLGLKNLHLQLEYSQVRPYSYASKKPSQSYTHYNQPLAHPLGANFREAIAFLNYRLGDFFTEFKFTYAITGKDFGNSNIGSNIFISDEYGNWGANFNATLYGKGWYPSITSKDIKMGYLVNPFTNLNIIVGLTIRTANLPSTYWEISNTTFVYFGIRTSLNNVYYDF